MNMLSTKLAVLSLLLLSSSALFAQVKIGSNPTTIDTTNNLEVEASTAGRKMKVDKTTGQVSIADGKNTNPPNLFSHRCHMAG
jgi:hypothetical protein